MATSVLHLEIPEPLKTYIEDRTEEDHHATPLDFVRELIEADRERKVSELHARLREAAAGEHFEIPLDKIEPGGLIDFLKSRRKSLP